MSQQVILLSDVPGLGQLGDKKTVKNGYALNYLLPKRLAVLATANALKRYELQKEKLEEKRKKNLTDAEGLAEKFSKVGLVFERPVGLGGRLFGSVTSHDVVQEIMRQGFRIEKKSVLMQGAIKTVGEHPIRVRLHSQIVIDIPVTIKPLQVTENKTSDDVEEVEEKTETKEPEEK